MAGPVHRIQWRPNVRAPVLDRLAVQSLTFDTAVSGTPVCCPYRASLLSGQYPLNNGVFINDVELKPRGVTMGEAFTRAGYHTGWIGKWHLYGSPDRQYGRRLASIPPEKRFGFDYWKACECTHDYNKSLYYEGNDTAPKYWPGYDAIAQTADACSFIDRQSKSNDPFCLVLSLGRRAFPLATAPEKYRAQFKQAEIRLRENVPQDHRTEAIEDLRGYYAHMAALDDCFKRLLGTLDHAGIADDTIVVFTSDHGDMMHSQGLTTAIAARSRTRCRTETAQRRLSAGGGIRPTRRTGALSRGQREGRPAPESLGRLGLDTAALIDRPKRSGTKPLRSKISQRESTHWRHPSPGIKKAGQ